MKPDTYAIVNTLLMSGSCMILYCVYYTTIQIEPRVLESMTHMSNGTYNGNGYVSLAVANLVISVFGWMAPSLLVLFGTRTCLVVSSFGFAIFAASVYQSTTWILYAGSALFGVAKSIFNSSNSTYLAKVSNRMTMIRNTGIYLALLQVGRAFGCVCVSYMFRGQVHISDETRNLLFIISVPLALVGSFSLLAVREPRAPALYDEETENIQEEVMPLSESSKRMKKYVIKHTSASSAAKSSKENSQESKATRERTGSFSQMQIAIRSFVLGIKLLGSRPMQQMFMLFCYAGFFNTYASTVYGTSISHTMAFGPMSNSLMTISATVYAFANLLSATLSIFLSSVIHRVGRDMVMLLVYILQMIVYYISFVQLPDESPLVGSDFESPDFQFTYTQPSLVALLIGSFLLGFTESLQTSQIYSIVQEVNSYPEQSFTIYRFFYSVCITISYFYANVITLKWQLLILVSSATVGAIGFLFAEMHCARHHNYQRMPKLRDEEVDV